MRILALLIAFIIWIIFISMIKATVDFKYTRREENDHIKINIKALGGLWKFNLEIPTIKLEWEKGPELLVSEQTSAGTGEKRKAQDKLMFRYIRRRLLYKLFPQIPSLLFGIKKAKAKFYKRIHCSYVNWKLGIGYKEPHDTAIAAGSLWAVLGFSLSRLYRQVTVDTPNPQILVEPNFKKEGFFCDLHCIFKLRIGHIIVVGLDLVRTFMRGRRNL